MENQIIKAKSKYVRQSPYKVRLVLNLIRGLEVNEALNILSFTKRKAAEEIKQVLESAIANAETNLGLNSSNLFISKAIADEGPTLKRFRPRARGRAGTFNNTVPISGRNSPYEPDFVIPVVAPDGAPVAEPFAPETIWNTLPASLNDTVLVSLLLSVN